MGPPEGLFAELSRWRDKATRRGKECDFNSDIIPDWLSEQVKAAIGAVGVDAAFSFLKASGAERMRRERELAARLEEELAKYEAEMLAAIEEKREPDYAALGLALGAILMPFLYSLAVEEAMRVSVDMGVEFDPAIISREALSWSQNYSYELIRGLTDTTRSVVSGAMQAYVQNPEMGQEGLRQLIDPAFGKVRAQMIATTETTRAYSEATNEYQRLLATSGVRTRRIWQTREDERVCDICGPLHGLYETEWTEFPGGPPAHVGCRCELLLETIGE